MDNYFAVLNEIDVSDRTEKEGNLTYLSWAWAWGELKKRYPAATYTIYEDAQGRNYHTDGKTCWVKTGLGQDDLGLATGLGARNISNRLCGKAPWRLDEVYKVCAVLDIPHDQIPMYFPPQQDTRAGGRRTA